MAAEIPRIWDRTTRVFAAVWSFTDPRRKNVTTVHIENTVQDFDTWKANFDKYERFRAEQGVQSYRVSRSVTEPNEVLIDLEFLDEMAAQAFLPKLDQIMNSPQARTQLRRHSIPRLYTVVTERVPSATG